VDPSPGTGLQVYLGRRDDVFGDDPDITMVSRSELGAIGDGGSAAPSVRGIDLNIGGEGFTMGVAFDSLATNLAPPDQVPGASEAIVSITTAAAPRQWDHDRVSADMSPFADTAAQASSSADGRFVAFAAASDDV